MKKLSFVALLIVTFVLTFAGGVDRNLLKTKTYVLVHGAWQAPYAWNFVKEQIEKKGHRVIVVNLPGHTDDTTAPSAITLNLYRDKVVNAINSVDGKVILVGHSFGGMSISGTAEKIPDKIEKMVYVGAFLPASGQSALTLASTDKNSLLGPSLQPSADQLTMDVKKENIINIFCADANAEIQELVKSNFKAEPAIPFTNSFELTPDHFGKVDKYYIHTLKDKNVSYPLQKQMVAAAGIKNVYSLNSSHCPFLTIPDQFTSLLLKISE